MAKIDTYLNAMVEVGGIALHIYCGRKPMFRLNDKLNSLNDKELDSSEVVSLLKEICPPDIWSKFEELKDIEFVYNNETSHFRCSCFMEHGGYGAVIHQLPTKMPSLDDIDVPTLFKDICHLPGGLILIGGSPNSGVNVTQAAMIEYINSNTSRYIINISELMEFKHVANRSIVEQCEATAEQMASALEAAIASHPDVIVLDLVPDARSVRLILRAAMTGILVIAATPTDCTEKTIEYIMELTPANQHDEVKTLLAESLQACIAQISCKEITGGKVICREILLRVSGVPSAIMSGNTGSLLTIMNNYRPQGMCSMDTSLRALLGTGKISAEEAYAKATDKKLFQNFLVQH